MTYVIWCYNSQLVLVGSPRVIVFLFLTKTAVRIKKEKLTALHYSVVHL